MLRPGRALIGWGSPSPRPQRWPRSMSMRSASALLATRTAGTPEVCTMRATARSSSPIGVVASVMTNPPPAPPPAASACPLMSAVRPPRRDSHPPVSTTRNGMPVHSARNSRRSRVTPGFSCTTAARRFRNRLTNVDLPTLGRPTMATTGRRLMAARIWGSGRCPHSPGCRRRERRIPPYHRPMVERVLLAEPRGFCAGVEMAIKALTWMVRVFQPPVYCFHEIVHNATVVEVFERAGVVFVDSITQVPVGAPIMLSAHGSAPEVVAAAAARSAVMVDAVCPLVTKVHHEVRSKVAAGFEIIYVGHDGHDEAVGTVAEAPESVTLVDPERGMGDFTPADPSRVALVAQTTLGMFEWESGLDDAPGRVPELWTARRSDLCYATTNRQEAVLELAKASDVVLVVGSETSSNTMALVRVAREHGLAAYPLDP